MNIWAAQMGVRVAQNPSGGPFEEDPRAQAHRVVRALTRRQRERAFGVGDVDDAAARLTAERRMAKVGSETRQRDVDEARAAGIGSGVLPAICHVLGRAALVLASFLVLGLIGGLIVCLVLDVTVAPGIVEGIFDVAPWLDTQLPLAIAVYPWVLFAVYDLLESLRRLLHRRGYLAWACQREGQLARGTAALPAPKLMGAGMVAMLFSLLACLALVMGLGIGGASVLMGDVAWALKILLGFAGAAVVFALIRAALRWRIKRIVLLHAALAGHTG